MAARRILNHQFLTRKSLSTLLTSLASQPWPYKHRYYGRYSYPRGCRPRSARYHCIRWQLQDVSTLLRINLEGERLVYVHLVFDSLDTLLQYLTRVLQDGLNQRSEGSASTINGTSDICQSPLRLTSLCSNAQDRASPWSG
jgi:hypothetical protein